MYTLDARRSLRALLLGLFAWMLLASSAWACGQKIPANIDLSEFCGNAASAKAHLAAERSTSCHHFPGAECQCESACGELGLSSECGCGVRMPEAPPPSETRIPQPVVLHFIVACPQPKNLAAPLVLEVGQAPTHHDDAPPSPPPR